MADRTANNGRPDPSQQAKPATSSSTSTIRERQNNDYRYNLRPASVARFPASSVGRDQPQQRSVSARETPGSTSKGRAARSISRSPVEAPTRTASPASTAGTASRSQSKDDDGLSEAAKRGQRRLSSRVLTDIDSPSPSEASSRAPSRNATLEHFQAAAVAAANSTSSKKGALRAGIDAPGPTGQLGPNKTPRAPEGRPKTTITGMPVRSSRDGLRLASHSMPEGERPNSKVLTTFPFPHPTTPSTSKLLGASYLDADQGGKHGGDGDEHGHGSRLSMRRIVGVLHTLGGWIDKAANVFAGPYERRLMAEEREDDELTRQIVDRLERGEGILPGSRRASLAGPSAAAPGPSVPAPGSDPARSGADLKRYGTFTTAATNGQSDAQRSSFLAPSTSFSSSISDNEVDPSDPYGYRRLAGPVLLPSYDADLATRRRERRRARSRARFQCMALWTIWTVSIVLVLLVFASGAEVWKDHKEKHATPAIGT